MIKRISKNVWQFYFSNSGSNCYLIKMYMKNILIDTSSGENRNELLHNLSKLSINPKDINIILLTHMHYDHISNLLIFKNAIAYASEEEISEFYKDPVATTLARMSENKIESIKVMLKPISTFKNKFIKVIKTPGHTKGSLCFYLPKEKILFSGDTIFNEGIGRTDFPTSNPEKLPVSIRKISHISYNILCPGH